MKLLDNQKLLNVTDGAKYLLGCEIVRTLDSGEVLRAKIVETESYYQEDPASHTFSGETPRTAAMFGEPGRAYIYFTYGMHWCFNVTAGPEGYGAGILIRAVEPIEGINSMKQNRNYHAPSMEKSAEKSKTFYNITNGPAKLAQALAINKALYAHSLTQLPLQIAEPISRNFEIVQTTRIGISKAKAELARFYIKDNPFISKK